MGAAGSDLESLIARARHFAAGEIDKSPRRAYAAARAATTAALERFDNETALRFLEVARGAARIAKLDLDESFFRSLGEAHLRVGALDESLRSFEAALEGARDRGQRAAVLGRIAWVHQTRGDPDRAWEALGGAFNEVGSRLPVESAASAARTLQHLARAELNQLKGTSRARDSWGDNEIELLCDLHYQNARLGVEYGKPLRLIQSTLDALALSAPLGPSRVQARALAAYGVVLSMLGRRTAGARELAKAKAMAAELEEPVVFAFCVQLQSMAAVFSGELDRGLHLLRECLEAHGPWLELNEYLHNATNAEFIESIRGRSNEAWQWITRAMDRLRRRRTNETMVAQSVVYRARAALSSMGRSTQEEEWLVAQLEVLARQPGQAKGFYHLLTWGPRARLLIENGDVGPAFDNLVLEFKAEKHNPRFVHPMVAEYYISVAHGRLHRCIRAPRSERGRHLPALREALADLRASARLPLFRAHRILIEACVAWFEGDRRRAARLFVDAETLAEQETCPWVLYGVARARAHVLREQGKADAARDQARVAETLAREHGSEPRARWIREEFALASPTSLSIAPSSHSSSVRSSHRSRRQLASLLHIVRAPQPELRPPQQAAVILDDILRELSAERGWLEFQPDPVLPGLVLIGRSRIGETLTGAEAWRATLIRGLRDTGEPWPIDGEPRSSPLAGSDAVPDPKRVLAAPLFLWERAVGGICLERSPTDAPFTLEDRELLLVLSHQVPVALEMARLFAEREQLHSSLQQAQKMEVVGQLAGGVAHDFNNMLMVIRASVDTLSQHEGIDGEMRGDLEVILEATVRAAQLTSQLLSFSRHRPLPLARLDLNRVISGLEPMLRRIMGDSFRVVLELDADAHAVRTDAASLEQVMVNLSVNARDAMPSGGTLSIATKNVVLDQNAVRRGAPKPGPYATIEVSDSGHGMSPEVLNRVFDPFFTTKPLGKGTGLGLTTAYAFVRKSGGFIDVSSEVGRGTTFRLHLPKDEEARIERPKARPRMASANVGSETILVVDDDASVLESIRGLLQRGGYRVFTAGGSDAALDLVAQRGAEISLVILDVQMPGMSGPELGRRLADLHVPAKLLFVSGYAPETLGAAVSAEMLLQKPFSNADLLGRVRTLLDA